MKDDKLKFLIFELQAVLVTEGVVAKECEYYGKNNIPGDCQLPHAMWMLGELLGEFEEWKKDDVGKINRWIGFIQGYLSAHGILSITELRDLTRTCLE